MRGEKKNKLEYFGKYFLQLLRYIYIYIYYGKCLKIFETF